MADVPLQPGEQLVWHRGQGTFHRGHDDAFAVSDRQAWLFLRRFSLRGRWIRIPLAEIESVVVEPAPVWRGLWQPLLYLAVFAVIAVQLWGVASARGWLGWTAIGLMLAYGAWLLPGLVRSQRGRTRLVLVHRGGRIDWVSYPDTYADEKSYDQQMIVEFAKRLGEAGVPVRSGR